MFDPLATAQIVIEQAQHHPLKFIEHIVAGSSSLVASLAITQRILQAAQVWAKKWFGTSRLPAWIGNTEYGVEAASDFVEIFALNWRQWILPPKPRDVWDDSKRAEQLGEKSSAAVAGKP